LAQRFGVGLLGERAVRDERIPGNVHLLILDRNLQHFLRDALVGIGLRLAELLVLQGFQEQEGGVFAVAHLEEGVGPLEDGLGRLEGGNRNRHLLF